MTTEVEVTSLLISESWMLVEHIPSYCGLNLNFKCLEITDRTKHNGITYILWNSHSDILLNSPNIRYMYL
jgi:hypothetical protein